MMQRRLEIWWRQELFSKSDDTVQQLLCATTAQLWLLHARTRAQAMQQSKLKASFRNLR